MKIPGIVKIKIKKYENSEKLPYLEITEVILVHCNIVSYIYQKNSIVLYTFVPNKSFSQLLNISLNNFMFLKNFDSELMVYRSKF